jgi:hypothetical protein
MRNSGGDVRNASCWMGNAGALLVFRFEQQLLAALDLRPLWIPIERELLFSQSPWGSSSYGLVAESGFYAKDF